MTTTPADHLATLERQDPTLMSGNRRAALEWALPILRASLATPAERESIAAELDLFANTESDISTTVMRQAAAMIRVPTTPTLSLMPAEIRQALDSLVGMIGDLSHRAALTWILREKRGSESTDSQQSKPSEPASQSIRLTDEDRRALMSLKEWISDLQGKPSWTKAIDRALRLDLSTAEIRSIGPTPTDKCPCCERVIQSIHGEAPAAMLEWVCSDCIDSGMMRQSQDPFILKEDDNSRDALVSMAVALESYTRSIGHTPENRRLMARSIRRFLSTFESLESAPCPSPGCPSNARHDAPNRLYQVDPRSVLRMAAESEASPTVKAAMLWAATTLTGGAMDQVIGELTKIWALVGGENGESAREAVQRVMAEHRQALDSCHPWETSDQHLAPQVQRIRQAIETIADWHEAEGTEATNGPTPGAKERAGERAMTLFRVVGLLSVAMGPAESDR